MITILLQLLIVAIVFGLILWLITQIPFFAPFAQIIKVVCVCLFIIYVIYVLMGLLGHPIVLH